MDSPLKELKILNGEDVLPLLNYNEEFWAFRHRMLLTKPEDTGPWMDTLVSIRECLSDCFCLLRANPSLFFNTGNVLFESKTVPNQ